MLFRNFGEMHVSSTRIKDAGIAIRHLRGYMISILQGPEMDFREWKRCVSRQKNRLILQKTYFSVMENYIEDVRQDEKHVPDVLEAIMRPTCLVKEELRPIVFKLTQFRPEITKIQV